MDVTTRFTASTHPGGGSGSQRKTQSSALGITCITMLERRPASSASLTVFQIGMIAAFTAMLVLANQRISRGNDGISETRAKSMLS